MLEKIKTFLKNFIFPPFSELHLYCLLILLCLVAFEYRAIIPKIPFILWEFNQKGDALKNYLQILVLSIVIINFLWVVIKNLISQKPPSFNDKKIMAGLFYLIFGFISLYAAFEQIYITSYTAWGKIEEIFIYFILARSVIKLIALQAASRAKEDHVYALQMKDSQIQIFEFILLIIGASVIYFLLRSSNPIATSFVLTYFYTTTALFYTKEIVEKFLTTTTTQNPISKI